MFLHVDIYDDVCKIFHQCCELNYFILKLVQCFFCFAYVIVTVKISQDNVKEICIAISYFMIQESLTCYIKEFITFIAFTIYESNPELRYDTMIDEMSIVFV